MFTKIEGNRLSSITPDAAQETSRFHDPVAATTAWTPMRGGGSNFQSHALRLISPSRYEFRTTLGMKLFCCVFLIPGLCALICAFIPGAWNTWHVGAIGTHKDTWGFLAFGSMFSLAGGGLLYSQTAPVVFDLQRRHFVRGRKSPEHCEDLSKLKYYTDIDRIHALQLIAERYDRSSNQRSYELNLVLTDGSRLNVIDHGGLNAIRADAQKLATFLGKPLWDAI